MTRTTFVGLLRDEIGLDVNVEDLGLGLDELPGWDSVQLLAVLVILERNADAQISLPALLEAGSLESIYQLVHA
ncbi:MULTISPECIES: acyl carrier protein [Frankia]|uniref:acyl carrier protein n=1 Tax=Frankia TaxID=1854 RepID=UPI0006873B6C|nr:MULTISPECIES: acyl carrier protein [Frankia]